MFLFFNYAGANFVLYSFPVLAISVLGFLYLDIGKTDVGHNNGRYFTSNSKYTHEFNGISVVLGVMINFSIYSG